MRLKSMWQTLRATIGEFYDDGAVTLAAALAFYAALSLAPFVVIVLYTTSLLGPDVVQELVSRIERTAGSQASQAVRTVIENAGSQYSAGVISLLIGLVVLVLSGTAVFVQLQEALNRIWDVERVRGGAAEVWIRKRLWSFALIFLILVLLLASLGASTVLGLLFEGTLLWVARLATSLVLFTVLFAAVYKLLPDVDIAWRDTLLGAAITSTLFTVGSLAVTQYLSAIGIGSAYGTAGSFLVLLVWVYSLAMVVFFGAELTQVISRRLGRGIHPSRHARRTGRKSDAPESVADRERRREGEDEVEREGEDRERRRGDHAGRRTGGAGP